MNKQEKPTEISSLEAGTIAALLKEKPKRGRPRRAVSRQNIYVALRPAEKELMKQLVSEIPVGLKRADLADLAISALTGQLEALRRAVAGRDRDIPEGVTDLESLYLLWDMPLPEHSQAERWTSIRVSPQQAIELGRVHGTFNAAFGASRSQTFSLALALLTKFLRSHNYANTPITLAELRREIIDSY